MVVSLTTQRLNRLSSIVLPTKTIPKCEVTRKFTANNVRFSATLPRAIAEPISENGLLERLRGMLVVSRKKLLWWLKELLAIPVLLRHRRQHVILLCWGVNVIRKQGQQKLLFFSAIFQSRFLHECAVLDVWKVLLNLVLDFFHDDITGYFNAYNPLLSMYP